MFTPVLANHIIHTYSYFYPCVGQSHSPHLIVCLPLVLANHIPHTYSYDYPCWQITFLAPIRMFTPVLANHIIHTYSYFYPCVGQSHSPHLIVCLPLVLANHIPHTYSYDYPCVGQSHSSHLFVC